MRHLDPDEQTVMWNVERYGRVRFGAPLIHAARRLVRSHLVTEVDSVEAPGKPAFQRKDAT